MAVFPAPRPRDVRLDARAGRPLSVDRQRTGERRHDDADDDPADRRGGAMTTPAWQRKLLTAGACALLGVLVDLARPVLGVQIATVGLGIGLIGASFMLAWAADAGETVFHGGLVLAVIALLTVLPERSEEHTSELQSHVNLVCRLL